MCSRQEAVSGETVRKFYSQIKGVRLGIYETTESTIYAPDTRLTALNSRQACP